MATMAAHLTFLHTVLTISSYKDKDVETAYDLATNQHCQMLHVSQKGFHTILNLLFLFLFSIYYYESHKTSLTVLVVLENKKGA